MKRRVLTENGWVRGLPAADPRITSYKGIPYAAPPVGENRWRAPQPCPDWEGELKAFDFTPIPMQPVKFQRRDLVYTREWSVDGEEPTSEDCLHLNIWTPADGYPVGVGDQYREHEDDVLPEPGNLPVFVWFYGGGLQNGHSSEMEFDGERIARRGVVVVTINYRVNVFGFFAHPELTAENPETPSNFGFLDQQFATRWVKRNIAAFGGDPNNITIGGQSAGGMSVCAQLANPENKGLFSRAIIDSGMFVNVYPSSRGLISDLKTAEARGVKLFEQLGVKTLAEARKIDAETLMNQALSWQPWGTWGSVIDGGFCKNPADQWYLLPDHVQCPVMFSATNNEFFMEPPAKNAKELEEYANQLPDAMKAPFLKAFEGADDETSIREKGLISAVDFAYHKAAKSLNGNTDMWLAQFAAEMPGWDHPGAFHSSDLWFYFETLAKCWRPFKGVHYDLARQMCDYWCNFMRTGNPNGNGSDGEPLPEWPGFTSSAPQRMVFDRCAHVESCEPTPVMKALLL